MRHLRVTWRHEADDEPVVLWSELDASSLEVRKVDEFRDGRLEYADSNRAAGSTFLADGPFPSIQEINGMGPFLAQPISAAEFERVWERANAMG